MIQLLWKKFTGHNRLIAESEDRLNQVRRQATKKLHLGCGNNYKNDYINVDAFSELADLKTNIIDLEPIDNNSVDLIETHHVLEHLSFSDSDNALLTWSKKLKPNGFLIISVPDLDRCCKVWVKATQDYKWNTVIKMIYGSQEHNGMFHKSGYSPEYLSEKLENNNFNIELVLENYPDRPTPSFLILASKR